MSQTSVVPIEAVLQLHARWRIGRVATVILEQSAAACNAA